MLAPPRASWVTRSKLVSRFCCFVSPLPHGDDVSIKGLNTCDVLRRLSSAQQMLLLLHHPTCETLSRLHPQRLRHPGRKHRQWPHDTGTVAGEELTQQQIQDSGILSPQRRQPANTPICIHDRPPPSPPTKTKTRAAMDASGNGMKRDQDKGLCRSLGVYFPKRIQQKASGLGTPRMVQGWLKYTLLKAGAPASQCPCNQHFVSRKGWSI